MANCGFIFPMDILNELAPISPELALTSSIKEALQGEKLVT